MMIPRHRQLIDYIRQHGDTSVEALATILDVTSQTIRRDIRELEEAQLLVRYHGGVGLPSTVQNIDYAQRKVMQIGSKQRIAQDVARHVEPGRSLILNLGTTTEEVSKALLRHKGIRVITNNLNVASILSDNPDAEIIIAGGLVRHRDRGVVGEATIDFIRQFKVDIGIIGVSGIEPDGTLLDYDYSEVRVTQAIIEQSREVWMVADQTKFTRHALVRLGHISQLDKFFTDQPLTAEMAHIFLTANVEVVVAEGGSAGAGTVANAHQN
jgi:DeoR family glycerol-3-phosphate regulon repressor